jgi:magnesium-transporting ATPase (P-type)
VNLRVEESALTGESVPSDKRAAPVPSDAGVGDRHGMGYSGTMVAAGRGVGVVTATGAATELGRITTMIAEVETLATPLTRQMHRFGRVLSVVIVGMAGCCSSSGACCTTTPPASCSSPPSASRSPPFPKGCPRF